MIRVVLLLLLALPAAGCATLGAALPDIVVAVTDGAQILDLIETFVATYFLAHPDPAAQTKVGDAIVKCRSALDVALRSAQGAKAVDDANVTAAFADFKAAYLELMALTQPYGVKPTALKLTASPGELKVPEPLAFLPQRGAR